MCHNNNCDTNCEKGHWYFLTKSLITHITPISEEKTVVLKISFKTCLKWIINSTHIQIDIT